MQIALVRLDAAYEYAKLLLKSARVSQLGWTRCFNFSTRCCNRPLIWTSRTANIVFLSQLLRRTSFRPWKVSACTSYPSYGQIRAQCAFLLVSLVNILSCATRFIERSSRLVPVWNNSPANMSSSAAIAGPLGGELFSPISNHGLAQQFYCHTSMGLVRRLMGLWSLRLLQQEG